MTQPPSISTLVETAWERLTDLCGRSSDQRILITKDELTDALAFLQSRIEEVEGALRFAELFADLWEKEPNGPDTLRAAIAFRAALTSENKANGNKT